MGWVLPSVEARLNMLAINKPEPAQWAELALNGQVKHETTSCCSVRCWYMAFILT